MADHFTQTDQCAATLSSRVGPAGQTMPMPAGKGMMHDQGYGVFLMIGLLAGLGVGLAIGQPSAGTVIGLGLGGLVALGLRLRRR